jgi:hypothetical protein
MSDEEYPCDPGYCQIVELHASIEALTEQIKAARLDAKEAEAYSVWLEGRLSKAVEAFKKLNVGEGWAAQIARATLAEIEGDKP